MIAIDTNILVYAHREDSEWHERAAAAVAGAAESSREWAITWPCLHEFLAIVTHPRIFRTPTPVDLAIGQIEAWLESPSLVLWPKTTNTLDCFREIVLASRTTGARVHDARVAALCVSHGIRELWTADRDFSMFPQLTARNPLVA